MSEISPQTAPAVLARGPKWLVINKPPGWLSVPPSAPGTVPVVLAWARLENPSVLPVHRLDVETSGVLVFALTPEAHREANQWFSKHEIKKLYHFIAGGTAPAQPTIKVSAPVEGKPATTLLEVKERFGKGFLGWARPLTGRRHQIRLHLSGLGHPILGDRKYGGDPGFGRVALHAARLELPTGEVFEAPWPADFARWVGELKAGQS